MLVVDQCRKCRIPVKTIASPAPSAAAITGAANLMATVRCRDLDHLYHYLSAEIGSTRSPSALGAPGASRTPSTALSTVRTHLHASVGQLEWTVNAYNLSFATMLILQAGYYMLVWRRKEITALV